MTNDAWNTSKDIIHTPLKMLWRAGDPKGKFVRTKSPKWSQECCQSQDCGSKGICQNPLFVSIFEKTFAPDNCDKVVFTFGRG